MPPTSGKVTVTVDQGLCVGNASCVAIAPEVFALDENRQSIVIDPDGAAWQFVLEAADDCPVGAIALFDAVSGDPVAE